MPRSACTSASAREVPSCTFRRRRSLSSDALQHLRDAGRHQILEAAGLPLGAVGVAGHERVLDVRGIGLRLFGHQSVADPKPQRLERGARDPAAMLVIGNIVDQERLERLKEQAGRIAKARGLGLAHRASCAAARTRPTRLPPGSCRATGRARARQSATPAPRASTPEGRLAAFQRSFNLAGHSRTTRTIIERS